MNYIAREASKLNDVYKAFVDELAVVIDEYS